MTTMKKTYIKDIWRSVKKGKKRFFSILLITALGVTMLTGLKAACTDLRDSADRFFDSQRLFDVSVVSTLGLSEKDIQILSGLEGVETAEGAYSATVHTCAADKLQSAEIKTFQKDGLNVPFLLEGTLPDAPCEIAVTAGYMEDTGKSVGDFLDIENSAEDSIFPAASYRITAIVIDPYDVNNTEGAVAFRASSTTEYTFFVTPEAAASDAYTAVYLKLSGSSNLLCYSDAYINLVQQFIQTIETNIKGQQELARYDEITSEAYKELEDAEREMNEQFAEADKEFSDAEEELEEGKAQLEEGERALEEQALAAEEGFASAKQQLADGYAALADGASTLDASEQQLSAGKQQLEQAREELAAKQEAMYMQLSEAQSRLESGLSEAESNREALLLQVTSASGILGSAWPLREWEAFLAAADNPDEAAAAQDAFLKALTDGLEPLLQEISQQIADLNPAVPGCEEQLLRLETQKKQLEDLPESLSELTSGISGLASTVTTLSQQLDSLTLQKQEADIQFTSAWQEISTKEAELEEGIRQLKSAQEELADNRTRLDNSSEELGLQQEEALRQLEAGRDELEENRQKLENGEQELREHQEEYQKEREKAEQELQDARGEIEDIDMTEWYIQDRSSLSGYSNIQSDASSIEAIGTAFPIVFLIVAVLISLTTTTRMVEEDRGLIGTYKALGFTDREIRRKYLIYAFSACMLGSALGDLCGFIMLPKIVFTIFQTMYLLPSYHLGFDLLYGIGGLLLFVISITGATFMACRSELNQKPAVLMRPKPPRLGSRIFLERFSSLWNRFSFLNKVTARNLFRYKKRMFMTTAGIMGCTALILCGFAIKDSVTDLMPRQYEQIYRYDLMAVFSPGENENLPAVLNGDENVEDFLNVQIDSVKIKNFRGREEKVQMIVIPDGSSPEGYLHLITPEGEAVQMDSSGIYVTQNAARVLGFTTGNTVSVQNSRLVQKDVKTAGLVQNYLGNTVYLTQSLYENLFGSWEPNGILAHLSESCQDQPTFAETLDRMDGVLSSVSTEALKRDFSTAFSMINMVVYIIIFMAAGLAFIVLFTLSATNISERMRELATIKVLGFYNNEAHAYVNKETLLLTAAGIALGLPLGHLLGNCMTSALKMPSIHFAVSIHPASYCFAAALSFCFAFLVGFITDRTLDKIDPVEALKSIE